MKDGLIEYLRLIRSENVGVKTFYTLINLYGSAKNAIEQISELSIKGGRCKPIKVTSVMEVEQEIEKCRKIGACILSYKDDLYPKLVKHIEDCPPIITVLGRTDLLNKKIISIVGSRNASANGCRFAFKLAQDLGENSIIIASGLARGIDTAAHKASIESGTIAVLAGGINHIYPPENRDLFEKIAANGTIIAELPYNSIPRSQNFPQRNRIISALALGTAVVEANMKSGSLITARFALSQNREVFAVPGFPMDPRCHGPNALIKQGATLIESAQDIIDTIDFTILNKQYNLYDNDKKDFLNVSLDLSKISDYEMSEARENILNYLSSSPITIDSLVEISNLQVALVQVIIVELELAERINRYPGNRIALRF